MSSSEHTSALPVLNSTNIDININNTHNNSNNHNNVNEISRAASSIYTASDKSRSKESSRASKRYKQYKVDTTKPFQPRPLNHLANERTYLTFIRASLSSIALGIAIIKFAKYNQNNTNNIFSTHTISTTRSYLAGSLLIGLAGIAIVYAAVMYKRINDKYEQGRYIINHTTTQAFIITIVTLVVVIAVMCILFL